MTRARDLAAFVSNADGDIKFDTDTLFIDSSANRVGIGTNTPSAPNEIVATSSGAATDLLHLRNNATATSTGGTIKFVNSTAGNSNSGSAEITAIRTGTNTGDLTFSTSNSSASMNEAMRIDDGGNVGIGNTSPDTPLYVDCGAPSSADKTIATFQSQTSRQIGFVWDDSASTMGIATLTNHPIAFHINGNSSETMRVTSDGLTFNGDTAAANALDDYEEGTWTPAHSNSFLEGAFASSTGFSNVTGVYVKIGNFVKVWAKILDITGESGNLVGDDNFSFTTASLPYTPDDMSSTFRAASGQVTAYHAVGSALIASGPIIFLQTNPSVVCQFTGFSNTVASTQAAYFIEAGYYSS